ncbi:MAG: ATP synthase F1 subunit delta [Bacteroidetes bacterium]|jgi:F-type H+-transporting ATPase subunit delta|nr:ATP synthase F1 subunit delta [Bacteroidota bacterium]MBL0017217.1 ATP synthase F1 subunit delta [Bacteroidota bacterium]MBP6639113.1 ATP synthase F1 subunit delta [Bacteroidia bacterium]
MIEIKLGDRYANSILVLAQERGQVERVREDFQLIQKVCRSNPDFVNMLESPLIKSDKKQHILDAIFGKSFCDITQTLIEIIVRKRREGYLDDIADRYLFQYDKLNNITRGILRSAAPLTADQIAKIKQLVEKEFKTSFEIVHEIDPSLLGGFVLNIGDRQFDASISTRLRALKNEFDSNPYVKQV